jgi:RNA polymerase-binding transcription factor DksA
MKRPIRKQVVAEPVSARNKAPSRTRPVVSAAGIGSTPPRLNPKWAWHYQVLLGLRERLLKEQSEQLAEAAEPLELHSMDMADSASDEFDHDMALSQLSAEQDALFEVEEALKRILNGTYGLCEETGKPIPEERLKAIPWARFAREVEARLENEGAVRRPHLGALGLVREELPGTLEESKSEEEKQSPEPEDEALREISSLAPPTHPRTAAPQKPKSR